MSECTRPDCPVTRDRLGFLTCEHHYPRDPVTVPARGEFLVRDGKVIEVVESELMEGGSETWAWRVWTDPQPED